MHLSCKGRGNFTFILNSYLRISDALKGHCFSEQLEMCPAALGELWGFLILISQYIPVYIEEHMELLCELHVQPTFGWSVDDHPREAQKSFGPQKEHTLRKDRFSAPPVLTMNTKETKQKDRQSFGLELYSRREFHLGENKSLSGRPLKEHSELCIHTSQQPHFPRHVFFFLRKIQSMGQLYFLKERNLKVRNNSGRT